MTGLTTQTASIDCMQASVAVRGVEQSNFVGSNRRHQRVPQPTNEPTMS